MGEARDRTQNKLAAERKRLAWPVNKTESEKEEEGGSKC